MNVIDKVIAFYKDPEQSLRPKIILTIYAVVGLPALPLACLQWLIHLLAFDKKMHPVDFLCIMMVFALFLVYPMGIYYYCHR